MSPQLSVIIPAYNEAGRLPVYLATVRPYLSASFGSNYEVLVIDDGSSDGLSDTLGEIAPEWPQLRVLHHARNLGKGAAVRTGMLAASGEVLLFTDADGATPIAEEQKLRRALHAGAAVAVGSRRLAGSELQRQRVWHRSFSSRLFTWVVRHYLHLSIRDTQCGFKMFHREAGLRLFQLCRERGYLFDLEVLLWAQSLGYRIDEVGVSWRDVPGSKVRLVGDGLRMLRGLWALRQMRSSWRGTRISAAAELANSSCP